MLGGMQTIIQLLYGWIPVILAVGSFVGSALVSWKIRSLVHCFLSGIIFIAVFSAVFMLYRIFYLDARASYLPHFIIVAAFAVFAAQGFSYFSHRHDVT